MLVTKIFFQAVIMKGYLPYKTNFCNEVALDV